MATLQELVEGKTLNELKELSEDLKNKIREAEEEEEEKQLKELRKDIRIDSPVWFYVGKGKDQKLIQGTVMQITRSGVTAMDEDGNRYNRRFKKLVRPEE